MNTHVGITIKCLLAMVMLAYVTGCASTAAYNYNKRGALIGRFHFAPPEKRITAALMT